MSNKTQSPDIKRKIEMLEYKYYVVDTLPSWVLGLSPQQIKALKKGFEYRADKSQRMNEWLNTVSEKELSHIWRIGEKSIRVIMQARGDKTL